MIDVLNLIGSILMKTLIVIIVLILIIFITWLIARKRRYKIYLKYAKKGTLCYFIHDDEKYYGEITHRYSAKSNSRIRIRYTYDDIETHTTINLKDTYPTI